MIFALTELYPDIPVLYEDGKDISYEERKSWNKFWLVDPLDGTKEFIKRNGEFAVNIALIENNLPVMGVIYAPSPKLFFMLRMEKVHLKKRAGMITKELKLETCLPKTKETDLPLLKADRI